jgi:NAD+ kinase
MDKTLKIHFHAAGHKAAQDALATLSDIYGQCAVEQAEIIVPLGGDGTMLEALHTYFPLGTPFYGMNLGTVGFMLNPYTPDNLKARLEKADSFEIHPLKMTAETTDGSHVEAIGFNEVCLFRETPHAAKITIEINGKQPMSESLIGDGVLVCTPAGSTAYNLSAGGSVIPLDGNILGLTPLSPFRPRRWRGALLPTITEFKFIVNEAETRAVRVETASQMFHNVRVVEVRQSRQNAATVMFDPEHNLEERIAREQFQP